MADDLGKLKADVADLNKQFLYLNEIAERLDGRRGSNRAIKQSDLTATASLMKSPAASSGVLATDYANLRADIQQIYVLLGKISNLYGTAAKAK